MKKVLLFMPYGSVGGMERLALTFYNFYKEQGYEVKALKIIKLENDIINFGADELFLSTKDFSGYNSKERFLFYLKIPFLLRRIIKKEKITHTISFGDMANLFSSLSFTKDYKIASIHAVKSIEFATESFLNKVFKKSYKTTYFFLDKVVCISNAIKKDIIENCGFNFVQKLEVIYNPHNLKEIQRLSLLPIEDEDEKKLLENSDIILFLGRMSIQKSPWHLIKSFKLVYERNPNTKLVFIGDGNDDVMNWLNELILNYKLRDKVVFLGRKSNPYPYVKNSKILALSSYYEGTPNVIVEAMALGIPVVSSNCTDGIGELMTLKHTKYKNNCIFTEAGIITPNFFTGELSIPMNLDINENEMIFAEALLEILSKNEFYRNELIKNKEELMKKFDCNNVAIEYLK